MARQGDWGLGRVLNPPATLRPDSGQARGYRGKAECRESRDPRNLLSCDQLVGVAGTNLSVGCGLRALAAAVSMASAAENLRSRCGSVRAAPEWSSQTSPTAAPQVVHGTENICLAVSSLVFTTT